MPRLDIKRAIDLRGTNIIDSDGLMNLESMERYMKAWQAVNRGWQPQRIVMTLEQVAAYQQALKPDHKSIDLEFNGIPIKLG